MALVVKRQVNVRKDCLRKQTNYSRSRAVFYREQRSNAQFVSAIMLGSLLTAVSLLLPQSSFSFTLLQLSLANFVPKPWRTRKLHWEYDIVNLNHTVPSNFTNFRLPKSKAPKTQSLIVSSGQAECLLAKMAFMYPVTPPAVLSPMLEAFIQVHKCIICIFAAFAAKEIVILPVSFYKPRERLFLICSLGAGIIPRKASSPVLRENCFGGQGSQGRSLRGKGLVLKLSWGGHFCREFCPRWVSRGANKSGLIGEEGFTRRPSHPNWCAAQWQTATAGEVPS